MGDRQDVDAGETADHDPREPTKLDEPEEGVRPITGDTNRAAVSARHASAARLSLAST